MNLSSDPKTINRDRFPNSDQSKSTEVSLDKFQLRSFLKIIKLHTKYVYVPGLTEFNSDFIVRIILVRFVIVTKGNRI